MHVTNTEKLSGLLVHINNISFLLNNFGQMFHFSLVEILFHEKIAIVNNSNDDAVVVRKNEPRRLVVFLMKSPHHNSYAGLPTSKHQPWLPVHSRARVHCMPTNGVAWKNRLVFQCLRPSVYTMADIVKLCSEITRKISKNHNI